MELSIFKTYDIRGIVPEELDEDAVRKIAAAQFEYLKPKTVVVGHDARNFSPEFAKAAIETFVGLGAKVYDIGLVPIELCYFACGYLKADAGMIITASHNPREYNGIKLIREEAKPLTSGSGLEEIKALAFETKKLNNIITEKQIGKIEKVDLWDEYIEKILSIIDESKIKPLKIICDASNGVGGLALEKLAEKIPLDLIKLNFKPDGNFPNHEPNPLIAQYREQAIEECKKHKDLSFAAILDGDADRVVFLNERGEYIDTDFISALIVKILLNKHAGEPVVFDLRRGWAIKDQAEILGSKFYPSKSGFPFIKQKMRAVNAIFGGEASAHYFYRDFFYSDSAMITLLLIVEYLSENNLKISEAIEEYLEGYFMYEETNFKVKSVKIIFSALKEEFNDGKLSELDGLSIDYPDWHFNLRSAATQPLVRLNIEGKDPGLIEEKRDQVIKIIENHSGTIVEE